MDWVDMLMTQSCATLAKLILSVLAGDIPTVVNERALPSKLMIKILIVLSSLNPSIYSKNITSF